MKTGEANTLRQHVEGIQMDKDLFTALKARQHAHNALQELVGVRAKLLFLLYYYLCVYYYYYYYY